MDRKRDRFYTSGDFLYVPECWNKKVKKSKKGQWCWYTEPRRPRFKNFRRCSEVYMGSFAFSVATVLLIRLFGW